MNEDAKNQLETVLRTYEGKLAEAERVAAATRAAQAAFPERFAALRANTIGPAMQELVDLLNGRGYEATATEQEESITTAGGVKLAASSLRIVPKPFAHKSGEAGKSFVEITFAANRAERKVIVSSANTIPGSSGNVGKRGDYDVEAVTADVIVTHVIQTLQDALK